MNGIRHGTHWRVSFWAPPQLPVSRLVRKADRQRPLRSKRSWVEYIHGVGPIGPEQLHGNGTGVARDKDCATAKRCLSC